MIAIFFVRIQEQKTKQRQDKLEEEEKQKLEDEANGIGAEDTTIDPKLAASAKERAHTLNYSPFRMKVKTLVESLAFFKFMMFLVMLNMVIHLNSVYMFKHLM